MFLIRSSHRNKQIIACLRVVCLAFTFSFLCTQYLHAQNWQWAKSAGGKLDDYADAMTTDATGNVYVTGIFYSPTITFGATTLINVGYTGIHSDNPSVFLTKYDAVGNVIWAKNVGEAILEGRSCITADATGNIYITGVFSDSTITFGATTLRNYGGGGATMFLVKYDGSGNVIWAKGSVGTGGDMGISVSADSWNNVYVTGYFSSLKVSFDTDTLTNASSTSVNGDVFLVKYDTAGNVIWARGAGGTGNDAGYSVATDVSGNVYVTGNTGSATITFGTTVLTGGTIFLVKYDSSGSVLWAKNANTGTYDGFATTDISGNIYVAGDFVSHTVTFDTITLSNSGEGDMFLVKYNAAGAALWARTASGGSSPEAIASDSLGNVYVAGSFANAAVTFGATTLTNRVNNGSSDMFIVKYDSTGNVVWASGVDTSSGNEAIALSLDHTGNIYVAGIFQGEFLPFGVTTLINDSGGTNDMFVAKLSNYAAAVPMIAAGQKNIVLYPNPNDGQMTVTLPAGGYSTLQIYDCLGNRVYTTALTGSEITVAIDLHTLPMGVYYLHAVSSSGSENIPFVISR